MLELEDVPTKSLPFMSTRTNSSPLWPILNGSPAAEAYKIVLFVLSLTQKVVLSLLVLLCRPTVTLAERLVVSTSRSPTLTTTCEESLTSRRLLGLIVPIPVFPLAKTVNAVAELASILKG